MAFNQILFQHSMFISNFLQGFGAEVQCAELVEQSRSPGGFHCPGYDGAVHADCPPTVRWAYNVFDCHNASFVLFDLRESFNAVMYAQSGLVGINYVHHHHIALLSGHMSVKVLPPLGG
jgi:hypothetical protein